MKREHFICFSHILKTFAIFSGALGADDSPFCYDDSEPCGPSKWGGICNVGNEGRQSPIHIRYDQTVTPVVDPTYLFSMSSRYHHKFKSFYIQNDGHSIQLSLPSQESKKLFISYDLARQHSYQFSGLHFHWGKENGGGSEHRIQNSSYVMEAHLVHWSEKYQSIQEAVQNMEDPKSLSVIGVFVKICGLLEKSAFTNIWKYVTEVGVRPSDKTMEVNAEFSLQQFLPVWLHHFSYLGSLTSPDCAEAVKWMVVKEPICIRENELNAFRNVKTYGNLLLDINNRPTQPIGNRQVTFHIGMPQIVTPIVG